MLYTMKSYLIAFKYMSGCKNIIVPMQVYTYICVTYRLTFWCTFITSSLLPFLLSLGRLLIHPVHCVTYVCTIINFNYGQNTHTCVEFVYKNDVEIKWIMGNSFYYTFCFLLFFAIFAKYAMRFVIVLQDLRKYLFIFEEFFARAYRFTEIHI